MNEKNTKLMKLIMVYMLTIIIFIFLFSKINFFEIIEIFKHINLFMITLAIFISFFNNLILNSDMWRRILKCLGCDISFEEAFFIRTANYSFKILFPMKSGEFIKAIYLKKQKNFPLKKGSASILFDIIITSCVLLSFMLACSIILKINSSNIFLIIPIGLILSFIIFFCLKATQNFILLVIKKINFKFYTMIKTLCAFEKIMSKKQSYFVLYAFIIRLITFINYYILSRTLNLGIPFPKIILFFPIIITISLLPITISGLGIRESLIILFFSEFASYKSLLSFGILISLVEYILPALFGLFFVKPFLSKMLYPKKL